MQQFTNRKRQISTCLLSWQLNEGASNITLCDDDHRLPVIGSRRLIPDGQFQQFVPFPHPERIPPEKSRRLADHLLYFSGHVPDERRIFLYD